MGKYQRSRGQYAQRKKPSASASKAKIIKEYQEDESKPVYFYMARDKPYGVFCQWRTSPFSIPTASLQWLVDLAPTPPTPSPHENSGETPAPKTAAEILAIYSPAIPFTCAEQPYMFCKSLFFSCATTCADILDTSDPKAQKNLGRGVQNYDDELWATVRFRVGLVVSWYKYTDARNAAMKDVLLGTGQREIAEASTRDRIWGIGFRAWEAENKRGQWGLNLLGKVLVCVRERIRDVEARREAGEEVSAEWDGVLEEKEGGGKEEKREKGRWKDKGKEDKSEIEIGVN